MTDTLYEPLPVVTDPTEPVTVPPIAAEHDRRTFLGLLGAVVAGVGLAFADAVASPFTRLAGAAAYESWEDCRGWVNASTVCVPHTAYYGSDNCDGSWHRQGWVGEPYGPNERHYTHNPTACSGRNAWKWKGGETTSTRRKCSDGYIKRYEWGVGPVWQSFSICRTAI